jgi:hypothetical protein
MTLPVERKRSINHARDFLRSLLDPKQTPRVPKEIRLQAYRVLKHYPSEYDVERLAKKCPDILELDQPIKSKKL